MSDPLSAPTARETQRVRHPLVFRKVEVVSVEVLTPTLRRIVVGGDELTGFLSAGFDDHMKIFPVRRGQALNLPVIGEDGMPVWGDPKPQARDYTPRAFDTERNLLTIEFVTGHGGPATEWAEQAQVGDLLGIGGPRGSMVVPTGFADHLLIGDETALPAIARRVEELPAGVRATAVIEIEDASHRTELTSRAGLTVHWVYRDGAPRGDGRALTEQALAVAACMDPADTHVWVATESAVARAMRPRLLAVNSFNPKHMKVAGYWRVGDVGAHQVFKDED